VVVFLDHVQRCALELLLADLESSRRAAIVDVALRRATLHELLTRVEEFESVLPGDHPLMIGGEAVPFERLRPYLLQQLDELCSLRARPS
jgi:hypothetical protein